METSTAPRLAGGRYRMHGLLGEGGMACVFDAFDERLGRPVAVKVLRPETQALPGMQLRFQREALIAARLVHPNIVSVLDYGQDHSSFFLVMERLPGTTLRDEIARGPLVKQRALLVVAETLAALAAAHRFGVLHRDIKPSNILLLGDGHTKISDFGIATSLGARTGDDRVHDATTTGFVLGTPGYLAPERRSGRPATVQSDLYSVGAVMIETITGKRIGDGTIPTESLPPVLRDIACRALAADPRDRFASAGDMLHALGTSPAFLTRRARAQPVASAADAAPVTPPLATPRTAIPTATPSIGPAARRSRRRWRRALSAGVAALALVAAVCLLLEEFSEPAGLTTGATTHDVARPGTHRTDPETTALEALATSLARAGLPGRTMASALEASAAQGPGTARQSTAQQALALARALLDEGGLTSRQYRDVVDVLRPIGATEPVAPITAPTPLFPGTFFQGRDHRHDHEYGSGYRG